jgi:hypothetical protein
MDDRCGAEDRRPIGSSADPGASPAIRRGPGAKRISSLMVAVAIIGAAVGLMRAYPITILIALFAVPPACLASRVVKSLVAQGEQVTVADRVAAFVCLTLFTVPIEIVLLFFCAVAAMRTWIID